MKIYGVSTQEFTKLSDAKKYARWFYGPNCEYILHYGIKRDGESSFNEGKKLNTGK